MQLLLLLLVVFAGGKRRPLEEVMPILETFGNEDVKTAVKRAEELSEVFDPAPISTDDGTDEDFFDSVINDEPPPIRPDYPLSPIEGIADDRVTDALARYIALGR